MADVYSTTPLNSKASEIRILELLPGPETGQIFGKLSRHHLDDSDQHVNAPYDALSYMWGTPKDAKTIHLNDNDSFKVTPNLSAALHALRLLDKPRAIWIDAICINQNDLQERSDQVQLMRKIYQQAATVYVWLDVEVDPEDQALRKLLTFNDHSIEKDLGDNASFWEPLSPIWKNPYWMRVWIQQEISNAAKVVIQCRNVLLPIFNVFHFIRVASSRVSAADINTPIWIDWADVNPNIRLPSRFCFLDSHSHPLEGSTLSDHDLNLLEILASSYKLQCTDNRDRVYGLLHLAHDYSEGDITISYDHSVKEVYTSVADFVLRKYTSLNFLLYAGLNWRLPDQERILPTWVPDWRDPSTRIWISPAPKLENQDPPLMSDFRPNLSVDSLTLNAYGLRIDRINHIINIPEGVQLYNTPTSAFIDTCRSIIQMALSYDTKSTLESDIGDHLDVPQWHILASVLTAVDCFKPEDDEAHAKLKQAIQMSADALVSTSHIAGTITGERPLTMLDVIRMGKQEGGTFDNGTMFTRLAWGAIGKHLPFVGENGGMGLALKSAKIGDEAWALFGCDKPMILRPVEDHYLVIGEGYCDGTNRGELKNVLQVTERLKVGDMFNGYRVKSLKLR
ncbi:heterokaryon incompatibility protein-domain-containing protein [Halenospora varia]|nr:heterokaryon incompatibility protein-domain-containing protein [Halenospora varia]